ncbi:MAG: methyltransferase domain-containing protein [Gammaproteobacteria bacterium]|nr:methyltransferase domain-containing protein [Gammaproteobacteria bacterium]MDH5692549.1 methyltransferase domain-containing protein [Gammaproteobacteria bacterium]
MGVKQLLKQSDTVVGFARDFRKVSILLTKKLARDRLIRNYLNSNSVRKLQIGAGPTTLPGWLSTDISPSNDNSIFLDATKTFPFENESFDYVFSEHMIEHVPWDSGLFMLKECKRVLKPGGRIRIATPDLKVLIGLYIEEGGALAEKYVEWITRNYLDNVTEIKASFVINNAFRNWGHQFLYDHELLELALNSAGFINIQKMSPGISNDANFQGIEFHGNNVNESEMASFETMVLEAERL